MSISSWAYSRPRLRPNDIAEPALARADERHDRVDVTTRAFLGLTVGCARCHDHKYDPIPIEDYYAIAGIFAYTDYLEYPVAPENEVKRFEAAKKVGAAIAKVCSDRGIGQVVFDRNGFIYHGRIRALA